ncbi:MAG: outer membrane protease [Cyclobacteriaceae bacterium]|jgi:outer membrane protease
MRKVNYQELNEIQGGGFAYDVGFAIRLLVIGATPSGACAVSYEIGRYMFYNQ